MNCKKIIRENKKNKKKTVSGQDWKLGQGQFVV